MVGHTHEDIDARFGTIWNHMRNRHIHTPQEYSRMIHGAYGTKLPIFVKDIWVVPNYKLLIKPYMDKKFGRYAKTCKDKNWTQFQFTFEAVEDIINFPLGVKTTYRRYCANEVVEIVSKTDTPAGFVEQYVKVKSYPEAKLERNGIPARPEGMYILQELPSKEMILPTGFKQGSRAEFDSTLKKVRALLPEKSKKEWEEFSELVPDSDDVNEYLLKYPDAM